MKHAIELPFSVDPLDPKLVLPKPKNSISDAKAQKLEKTGKLIKTRKRDGYRVYVAITTNGVTIYTRGVDNITSRFPHIVEQMGYIIKAFPKPILLDGELIFDRNGKDDYNAVAKMVKATPENAIRFQEEEREHNRGSAKLMVFNPVVWGGGLMLPLPHAKRLQLIASVFHPDLTYARDIIPLEILDCTLEEAEALVLKNGWEGLVLYDGTKASEFRLDGKTESPPRPEGAWKRKPTFEDDFIVRGWNYGTGKNAKRMGELHISQIDSATGKEVSYSVVGLGFTDKEREEFTTKSYPLVIQVEFQKRFPSGKLFSAVYTRTREDKKPEECIRQT